MKTPEEVAREVERFCSGCNRSNKEPLATWLACCPDSNYEYVKYKDYLAAIRTARKITGETSDGYHTFNELYDHRVLLWINICLMNSDKAYVVEDHFDGWFLLGQETEFGQISYHAPNKFLYLVECIKRHYPLFDGHTSKDVISRLELNAAAIRARKGGK